MKIQPLKRQISTTKYSQIKHFFSGLSKRWRHNLLRAIAALLSVIIGTVLSAVLSPAVAQAPSDQASLVQPPVAASAGEATVFNRTSSAYEAAPPNLTTQGQIDHDLGDEAFEEAFVPTALVSGAGHAKAGLGPLFNNASCESCHIRNGRGMPEVGQLLLRVSDPAVQTKAQQSAPEALSGTEPELMNNAPPVAGLGNQIQDFSILGEAPEATVDILWQETAGTYGDGTPYRLRSPQFNITLASGEPLPETVQISPRVPPHVYGLGLLEAIPEADIIALADPNDDNGDGISGRPNQVWDVQTKALALGRFGWKANSPNLLQQSADAYLNDMGIHNPLFPAEDGSTEIDQATLVAAAAYAQTLAVPARTLINDPQVQQGEKLFNDASCQTCHVASFTTGAHKYPALENQTIHPYTDSLLHDMGEALADNRADFAASGQEWRTPSLWGIGLAQTVLPYSGYLHDGRARTFAEAILWHGGEAEAAKVAFEQMPAAERDALVRFLQSL
ncbi:MAG: di-heme oxidoredictase family protein [Cyanobacteria bacterium J06559_1]